MKTADFIVDLIQDVRTRQELTGSEEEAAFAEIVTEYLAENGDISEFFAASWKSKGVKVDGYAYLPDESTLDLFVVKYSGTLHVETITRTEVEKVFKRVETFFEKCLTIRFVDAIDFDSTASDLGTLIYKNPEDIRRVRFYLLTDSVLSDKVKEIPNRQEGGREWSYRVWDLDRLSKVMGDGTPEPILVDFVELFGEPLRCLPAIMDHEELESYLTVIPGEWLASIYDQYSGRLLEQNVRTFLQLKGKVNKGIRQTILSEPEYFFAYNNGISATANGAEFVKRNGLVEIKRITNLQVVNGGQTTASLFHCLKRDKNAQLGKVQVQMKLTIIADSEKIQSLVPRISKFANSQNKISNADFFSNHPFHVRLETISRRIWAPGTCGSQIQTHWFYERARGQHANMMSYLTPAKKREFLLQNPKSQVLTKTDVAKHFNTFRQLPHDVSRGAERNFALFAEYVGDRWESGEAQFSETWFQQAVARAIVFRAVERLVQKAPWYNGGYRANLVTYGIALLVHHYEKEGKSLDLKRIWLDQAVSGSFESQILEVCEAIFERIVEAAADRGLANVTEWCKKAACWEDVKNTVQVQSRSAHREELISTDEAKVELSEGRRTQLFDNEVEALNAVVCLGGAYWMKVLAWSRGQREVGPKDLPVLRVASAIPNKLPQTWQAARLMEISELYDNSLCSI